MQSKDKESTSQEVEYSHKNLQMLIDEFPKKILDKESKLRTSLDKAKISDDKKLLRIYDFYNLAGDAMSKFTPCKKGCSHCCHYNVSITEDEASLIERGSGRKRNKKVGASLDYYGEPCPFLSSKLECTIYEYRPYSCRRHYALTKTDYLCNPNKCNDVEVALVRFSEVEGAFDKIRRDKNTYDIRQLFG